MTGKANKTDAMPPLRFFGMPATYIKALMRHTIDIPSSCPLKLTVLSYQKRTRLLESKSFHNSCAKDGAGLQAQRAEGNGKPVPGRPQIGSPSHDPIGYTP